MIVSCFVVVYSSSRKDSTKSYLHIAKIYEYDGYMDYMAVITGINRGIYHLGENSFMTKSGGNCQKLPFLS